MTVTVQGWTQVEHGDRATWVRREGDSLTVQTHTDHALLPVWVELGDQAIAHWMLVDTGAVVTAVARGVVETAGVNVEELPPEDGQVIMMSNTAYLRASIYRCPGRILLFDGRPLLEGGFRVYAEEPPPEHHMRGVASQVGVDVFRGWRFSFDYTRRPEPGELYEPMEHDPVFTLTPAGVDPMPFAPGGRLDGGGPGA